MFWIKSDKVKRNVEAPSIFRTD